MANWERKSSYLLREIVKFRTYIDSLTAAQTQKEKIYAQREADASKNAELNGDSTQQMHSLNAENDGGREAHQASEPHSITA